MFSRSSRVISGFVARTAVIARMPGDGAPGWARAELNALYVGGLELNATPPPGLRAGGCSDGAVVPARTRGAFVYSVGRGLDGAILSVAVNSFRFGPAIFLAPAAQRVLRPGRMARACGCHPGSDG